MTYEFESLFARTSGEVIVDVALFALGVREREPTESIARRLRAGEPRLHAEFRVSLAWALRRALERELAELRSVHVIGSSLEDAARVTSDLDIVVRLRSVNDAARAALAELNESVTRAYGDVVGPLPEGFLLLDVHVVPDDLVDAPGMGRSLRGSAVARHAVVPDR